MDVDGGTNKVKVYIKPYRAKDANNKFIFKKISKKVKNTNKEYQRLSGIKEIKKLSMNNKIKNINLK